MAEQALKGALHENHENLILWLSAKLLTEQDDANAPQCSRSDFALYFMTYLKTWTQRFLQSEDATQETVRNQTSPVNRPSQIDVRQDAQIKTNVEYITNKENIFNQSANDKSPHSPLNNSTIDSSMYAAGNQSELNCSNEFNYSFDSCTTPQRKQLDNSFILSPVTPLNHSSIRFSTPNVRSTPNNDSSNRVIRTKHQSFNSPITTYRKVDQFPRENTSKCINLSFPQQENQFNINDKDMFPDISADKNSGRSRRRIKPTRLNMTFPMPDSDFKSNSDDIKFGIKYDQVVQHDAFNNFQPNEHHAGDVKTITERDMLKKEIENLKEKFNEINTCTPKKIPNGIVPVINENLKKTQNKYIFEISQVTDEKMLNIFSLIFSTILDFNLVANVASEMYYLLSLATLQEINLKLIDERSLTDDQKVFSNINNCVYFAIATLEKQKHLLRVLTDKNCLKSLLQNDRIKSYSKDFFDCLTDVYTKKLEMDLKLDQDTNFESSSNKNVCFITDTDSADNFPTQRNFLSFKRQRDEFYNIFRCWESNRQTPDWKFNAQLGTKIKNLIMTDNSSNNLTHLARLFKDQLLTTCIKQNKSAETLVHLQATIATKRLSHNKISNLCDRLTGALPAQISQIDQNELSSPPDFIGDEEFFRDFILESSSTAFREHLINSLAQEICRFDEAGFLASDREEIDTTIDQETKMQYLTYIKSLRVLAKFLGFLMALPYKSNTELTSERVLNSEILIRNHTLPPMNLILIVRKSKENGKLILTIPWIVELLAMLDYCFLRIMYFKNLLEVLFQIYAENVNVSSINESKVPIPFINKSLIRICLGWLFDMQHFPQESLTVWLVNNDNKNESLSDDHSKNESDFKNNQSADFTELQENKNDDEMSLDRLEMVDEEVVKVVCPYLKEFRYLLIRNQNTNEGCGSRNIKHIRPITSSFCGDKPKNKNRDLQMRLEEWFLRSQPGTTRKILDIVSDRTGAALIRLAKAQLPAFSERAYETAVANGSHPNKDMATLAVTNVYNNCLMEFHMGCKRAGLRAARKRIIGALQGLLPPGTPKALLDMYAQISIRNAMKKLMHCLQTQYNSISIFTSNLRITVRKVMYHCEKFNSDFPLNLVAKTSTSIFITDKSIIDDFKTECKEMSTIDKPSVSKFDDEYCSPTLLMIELKEFLICLLSQHAEEYIVKQGFYSLLQQIKKCSSYKYVVKVMKEYMIQLSLDIIILILSCYSNLITDDLLNHAKNAWLSCLDTPSLERQDLINPEIEEFRNSMQISDRLDGNNIIKNTMPEIVHIINSEQSQNESLNEEDTSSSSNTSNFFNSVICGRNLLIIENSSPPSNAKWKAFSKLLLFLLNNDFLTDDCVLEQCLAIYREDWSKSTLANFVESIKEVSDERKSSMKPKDNLMLEFLSDFCENLDGDYSPL